MSGAFSPRTRDDVRRLDGEISERFLTLFLDKCDADEALFFFAFCATPMIVSTFVFAASMPIDFIRSMFWRTRKSRAASYALTTTFFVELVVSQKDKPDDAHVVVYHAGYTHPEYERIRAAIIDNEKDTPVKLIEPSDRGMELVEGKEVPAARRVFASLFPFTSRVRVTGAWLMRKATKLHIM